MNLERFIVVLAAGFFLLYGLAFSIAPAAVALFVTSSAPTGASALVDFRATYGGMTLAVGVAIFFLYAIGQVRACLMVHGCPMLWRAFDSGPIATSRTSFRS